MKTMEEIALEAFRLITIYASNTDVADNLFTAEYLGSVYRDKIFGNAYDIASYQKYLESKLTKLRVEYRQAEGGRTKRDIKLRIEALKWVLS